MKSSKTVILIVAIVMVLFIAGAIFYKNSVYKLSLTDQKNTPYPTVTPGLVSNGISDDCDSFHGVKVLNCWFGTINGKETGVYAGGETSEYDLTEGVVIVMQPGPEYFYTPLHFGSVRITDQTGNIVTLSTSDNAHVFHFDLSTRKFIDK
jgi:hypothetical protein